MTSSCSVADAAAAPSFASARRREAGDRAQTVTAALCNLRSVSQWVRRVYSPQPRRVTDRSLSSPATAVCIPHVCGSRPHATRCACAVHGMKCGWRACERCERARWCGFSTFAFHYHMCVIAHTALTSRSTTAMSWMQKVRIGMTDSTFFYLSRGCGLNKRASARRHSARSCIGSDWGHLRLVDQYYCSVRSSSVACKHFI